jgi:DNA (cytosine-5)-methyltransferase 1
MKHLGDISKVNGAEIEPVDIITFGSPCQDLSVAGKRAGLKHEANGDDETTRSGLFMEAVRIIKEMRKATNGKYPKFCIWENVPGAFSSNNGQDFRVVLEELIKIVEPNAVMPEVPQKGWAYADYYSGDGWSLAYRVFDAQYWGVPQRRRRIYLVADFRGECAREILFEREGLRGYFTQGGKPWEAAPSDTERCVGADDREGEIPYTLKIRSGVSVDSYGKAAGKGALIQEDKSATLGCNQDQYLFQPIGVDVYNTAVTGEVVCPLTAGGHTSTGTCPKVMIPATSEPIAVATQQGGAEITENGICPTITAAAGMSGNNQPWICQGVDAYNQVLTGDKAKTLNSAASDADHVPCTVYSVENHPNDSRVKIDDDGKVQALTSRMGTGGGNVPMVMEERPKVINLNKDDVQSKTVLDPNGIAPALYAGECRGGGGECYVMQQYHKDVAYGLDRASFNQGQNAKFDFSILDEQQPTLTARGPGAVCCADDTESVAYSFDPGASRDVGVLFIEECGKTLTNGTCPGHHDGVVISEPCHTITTGSFTQVEEEKSPTLMARDYKDPTCVEFFDAKERRYIVRRLTPTECARLQGFPDEWGHLTPKTSLTDDEYKFWLKVRKTHDAINGRTEKEYNEKQMLTYYNKLWTDSSEYKMWGNGIALPTALYVMQGIKEVLDADKTARSNWLLNLLNN